MYIAIHYHYHVSPINLETRLIHSAATFFSRTNQFKFPNSRACPHHLVYLILSDQNLISNTNATTPDLKS